MGFLKASMLFLRAMLISKVLLALENLALRQQLAVSHQSGKRPKLRPRDRVFWVWLSMLWSNWRSALGIAQARNGHQVASNGIQAVLAVEIEGKKTWTYVPHPYGLLRLLSQFQATSFAGSQLADAT